MGFLKKLFKMKEPIDTEATWKELKPRVEHFSKPSVRLYTKKGNSSSRFGGRPLVASEDFQWPESNGKPMAFLAQIDLQEINKATDFEWLPKSGYLLFFYDVLEMPWGFDPKDRGKWKVIFQNEAKYQKEYPSNIAKDLKFKELFVRSQKEMTLPDIDSPEINSLKLSEDETDAYIDCKCDQDDDKPNHQIGGFPMLVQGNYMQLESQLASNGIYVGEPSGYESDEAKMLASGAKNWKLLLQFDGDDELGTMWGDCGSLYFWVEQDKAKNCNFEDVWLVLQCC